jgi:hypothetical protein
MNSLKEFNTRRFLLLIRNDLFLNRKYILIFLTVIIGVLLFQLMTSQSWQEIRIIDHPNFYDLALFILGISLTERIFREIHDEVKGPAYLTLPASTLEKFLSRFVLCTIIIFVGITMYLFLVSLSLGGVNNLLTGESNKFFQPFNKQILTTGWTFFISQSCFMLGAIYFKKNSFIKTILSIVTYFLIFLILEAVIFKIFTGGPFGKIFFPYSKFAVKNEPFIKALKLSDNTIKIILWYFLAPIFWLIAYIRLKEKEV